MTTTRTSSLAAALLVALGLAAACRESPRPPAPAPTGSASPPAPPAAPPADAAAASPARPASPDAAAEAPPASAGAAPAEPVAPEKPAPERVAAEAEPAPAAEPPPPPRRPPPPPPPPPPPEAPGGVAAQPLSATELEVTWQRGEGGGAPVRYEVRGGEEVLLTTGTSLRVARLAPARTACFAVTAIGETGLRSPQSAPGCAATLPDTTPPSAPAGLAAEARTREVLLRWQPARDDVAVAGYEVARGEKMVARSTELRAAEQEPGAGRHCYRVRAVDAAGNRSEPSPEACATTPDVAPPAAPSELAVEPGEAEVALSWKVPADDVGVAGYELWRDGALVARPSQPAARETGLRPASRHCWQVAALDAAGNRSPLSTAACAVTLDRTPPTAPRGLAAAPDGAGVALSWSAATDQVGVAGYQVWRGAAEVARTTELRWADPGPMSSAESCYAVRAFDAAGNVSPPSEQACARTPDTSPPSAPAELAAAPASATELVLAWAPATDNVGVVRYEVLRGDQKIASGPEPRAAEAKLAPLTEYCYTVRAFDAAGNGSPPARACARTADPALPAAPTVLEARRLAADELELRWRASPAPGAVYLVYWDGTKGAPGRAGNGARLFGETPLTALKVFGAPARQRHCYQVAARSGDKESPRTLPLCVEPAGRRP